MNQKKKVIIVAYAYEPGKTSEPGVGWHFAHEIAKFMDVTVLTRANNKLSIEKIKDDVNIRYVYFDLKPFYTKIKKNIPLGIQIYFSLWQHGAYKELKRILINEKFDIIHHLTFGMTKLVPPAYKFDLPFIWGPIGGGDTIPFNFLKKMGLKPIIDEGIYRFVHKISDLSPFSYLTRNKVSNISFRTYSSMDGFPKTGCKNRKVISESAMPDVKFIKNIKKSLNNFQILCIGRMIHGKGYDYALKGFYDFLLKGGKGKLIFLGDGPEKKKLSFFVKKNKISEYVEFRGFVGHEQVVKILEKSHILLHPSFREGGSWSIMEAMSYGLPVICLNTSGPKDMVSDTGVLIDLTDPKHVVKDISKALGLLYEDKELYYKLSKKAANRIKNEYNWGKRREQIKKVYDGVLLG